MININTTNKKIILKTAGRRCEEDIQFTFDDSLIAGVPVEISSLDDSFLVESNIGKVYKCNSKMYTISGEKSDVPTDLAGYRVTVPAGWTAEAEYGYFMFNFNDRYALDSNGERVEIANVDYTFAIGYSSAFMGELVPGENKISITEHFGGGGNLTAITPEYSIVLEIKTPEDEAETSRDPKLIQWFVDNNATFEVYDESVAVSPYDMKFEEIVVPEGMIEIEENGIMDVAKYEVAYVRVEPTLPPVINYYQGEVEYGMEEGNSVPTDLTGYKVTIPAGWTAEAGFGKFNIGGLFALSDATDLGYFDDIELGYENIDGEVEKENCMCLYGSTHTNDSSIQLIFLNSEYNEDATNPQFIQWLVDNDATFEKIEEDKMYFVIDNTIYTNAAKGTTWEQWINDNPDSFVSGGTITDDGYITIPTWTLGATCYLTYKWDNYDESDESHKVHKDDLIENRIYYTYEEL